MFHWYWLILPCILFPFLLFDIIVGIVDFGFIILFFVLVHINKFLSVKLLLGIAMFAEGFLSSVAAGISLDNCTKIGFAVIYILHDLNFCLIIFEHTYIQCQGLEDVYKRQVFISTIMINLNCY